jgi:hypothetical protein
VQKKLKVSMEIIWWTKARKIMPKMLWIKLIVTLKFVGFSSEEGIKRERPEKNSTNCIVKTGVLITTIYHHGFY